MIRTTGDFQAASLDDSQGSWNCDNPLNSDIKPQGFVLTSPELER